jgi:hypothetical protein
MFIYVGDPDSKRCTFFRNAAGGELAVFDYDNLTLDSLEGSVVKLDPPKSSDMYQVASLMTQKLTYSEHLKKLSTLKSTAFLNHPNAVMRLLDKLSCKNTLKENGVPITPILFEDEEIHTYDELMTKLEEVKVTQVFLKPRFGSGAAGVMALRLNPHRNLKVLYTCAVIRDDTLINTKTVRSYVDAGTIKRFIDLLLASPTFIELWIPKDSFNSYTYDLRAVFQCGSLEYLLPRLSKSPITNQHLNNKAAFIDELNLPSTLIDEIQSLCKACAGLFEGLNSVGIDILITKSQKPLIIEMNAHGDYIHQDLYHENRIYRRQVEFLRNNYCYE